MKITLLQWTKKEKEQANTKIYFGGILDQDFRDITNANMVLKIEEYNSANEKIAEHSYPILSTFINNSVFVIYFYLSFVFCFLQNSAVSKINVYKLREKGLVLINNVHIHQSFIREIECMNHSINQPAID